MRNSQQANLKFIPTDKSQALCKAIEAEDINTLYECLGAGVDYINDLNHYEDYLIHHAVNCKKMMSLRILIAFGADPNLQNKSGHTPLHAAVRVGSLALVEELLNNNADPFLREKQGETPLDTAEKHRKYGGENLKIIAVLEHHKLMSKQSQKQPVAAATKPSPQSSNSNNNHQPLFQHNLMQSDKKPLTPQLNNANENNQKLVQNSQSKNEKLFAFLKKFDDTPEEFICPLSLEMMEDPVITPAGRTYERKEAEAWIKKHGTEPVVNTIKMTVNQLIPNLALKEAIENHKTLQEMTKGFTESINLNARLVLT